MYERKERPGVMLYFSDWVPMLSLDDPKLAALLRAAVRYGALGEVPEFEGVDAVLWGMIASRIDRDGKAFEGKCRDARYKRYKGIEKSNGREPLEFEDWAEQIDQCRPMSTGVDQSQEQSILTPSINSIHPYSQPQITSTYSQDDEEAIFVPAPSETREEKRKRLCMDW